MYPLTFHPIFKERVWGGRTLERLYHKVLPPTVPIGESWEVSDRPGDESIIANGTHAGRTLRWLMDHHGADVLGQARPAAGGRFPLLCKILDARDKLSLQVHPPANLAVDLGGEPKTEMWYIADASPDAELYVGLKRGTTRAEFESRLDTGGVEACFHRIPVQRGDTMFLPSGRVHAIGAGLVIFEIQQNSDTTYRVYDWDRVGLDGIPRELHVAQSLASIDFDDFEPTLARADSSTVGSFQVNPLVRHALFNADITRALDDGTLCLTGGTLRIAAAIDGRVVVQGGGVAVPVGVGQFCVIPAALDDVSVSGDADAKVLMVEAGH